MYLSLEGESVFLGARVTGPSNFPQRGEPDFFLQGYPSVPSTSCFHYSLGLYLTDLYYGNVRNRITKLYNRLVLGSLIVFEGK
jgi:hypothetical protein